METTRECRARRHLHIGATSHAIGDTPEPRKSAGVNTGPHMIMLTHDDKRLVVTDYFLNEDDFGKIHFEGDHHVHVIKVFKDHLQLDPRFDVDFNTAFPTGPARPHGFDMK